MTASMTQARFARPAVGTVVTTAGDREIVIRREFDAPRRLVWRTLTEPELVKRWMFGPSGWAFTICEIDLRVGGRYRYEWRNEDGRSMGLGGVYRVIARPERLVSTERFDGEHDSGETLVTTALAEREGRTTLTMTLRYESRRVRDEAIESNMAEGLDMSFRRVDAVLAELLASER
jgi:uncharacterized protein YndB with AHSA1/START domain